MAKSNPTLTLVRNSKGQISIFFSASLMVFISLIAFVINIGLFVKAKINLQNATDAAAFAGAAVQARQLSKIANLNWEMRNIFKEWMYKYYVVGNLNVPMVQNAAASGKPCSTGRCIDFRLAPDVNVLTNPPTQNIDAYNFPSTCIHIAGTTTNICRNFGVPGLPEFGGNNMTGTEEASRAFQDALIGSKTEDCSKRSQLNMLANTTWAYNVLTSNIGLTLASQAPAIMSDRQGAWPRALELAMRMRNLELVVNREAVTQPVTVQSVGQYEMEKKLGNERIVKAFYSGYRNLGNQIDDEMKASFTLKEIPPKSFSETSIYSNSNLLIPSPYPKQYLDLQLMMVNYATFSTAFLSNATPGSSGACGVSKIAIPVPGYPLGYYKNPNVLTYYAVKGEAEFEGMFNPFNVHKVKLTAYAAAKPAGGRIGPMLFKQKKGEEAIRPRTDINKYRSVPYVASLDVVGTWNRFLSRNLALGEFAIGAPLPMNISANNRFWIKDALSPVGGLASGSDVQFGVPNLVYDFIGGNMDPNNYTDQGSYLFTIEPRDESLDKPIGLFNFDQFKAFKGDLPAIVTPQILASQIARVRAATRYEAANYLIPTPHEMNLASKVDSFGMIGGQGRDDSNIPGLKTYSSDIYAPLYKGTNDQVDILYNGPQDVLSSIVQFMLAQKSGIDNYIYSMNKAALEVYRTAGQGTLAAVGAIPSYEKAAQIISDIDVTSTATNAHLTLPKSCGSMAGMFYEFYYGDNDLFPGAITDKTTTPCPIHLVELLRQYFSASASDPNYNPLYYRMEYSYYEGNWTASAPNLHIFSAYMPGPYTGVGRSGFLVPPPGFPGDATSELMRRNFYSTKLVAIESLRHGSKYDGKSLFSIYSEGDVSTASGFDRSQEDFANALDIMSEPNISTIKY